MAGDPQVVNLEPTCLKDVFDGIRDVGVATHRQETAESFLAELAHRIALVRNRSRQIIERPSVMLLEWIDPPFSAGHWNPELVELAGGREVIGVAGQRSVTTRWEDIRQIDPEVMIIACCGFDGQRARQDLPILESNPGWQSLRCVKSNRVYLVDGSAYFNRPGPRLIDSLEILAHALHPRLHPLPSRLPSAIRVV